MADSDKPEGKSKIPWLKLTSESCHIPERLAAELAGVVIEWGKFEMSIVADTSIMMAYPDVRKLTEDAPRSFKQKIELWKLCVHTLYPSVDLYRNWATEICSKGKSVARHRHRLIHGLWDVSESKQPGLFRIFTYKGLERIEEKSDLFIDTEYVAAVHNDIRALSDALASLITNRMWHAHQGFLKTVPGREP